MEKGADSSVREFWDWFGANAGAIAADVRDRTFLEEIDERVTNHAPGLSWEIGPGKVKPWQLVISPNLDREYRELARSIVAQAPELDDWEFHSAREPKEWNYRFELVGDGNAEPIAIDATNWTFVLLEYPEGTREILFKAPDFRMLSGEELWIAGAIVIESIIGEDAFLDTVNDFAVLNEFEPQFASRERPIQSLREALIGNEL